MRKENRKAKQQAVVLPLAVGVIVLIGAISFYQIGTRTPETDSRFCPKETGPVGATILLLDTSDPLTSKHKAELESLAKQITSEQSSPIGISAGELLLIYKLTEDSGSPNKVYELCRPYVNPNNRSWRDGIHRGWRFHMRDWESFESELTKLFPEHDNKPLSFSPLLETIAVIAAHHIPRNNNEEHYKVHLIIFSDLLQYTSRLSHYGPYPDAKEIKHDLLTDLAGAQISLYRLVRPKYTKYQNERHYSWWRDLIKIQGGHLKSEVSL